MSKVRIAVIGAGWISQEAFLPAVRQTGNAEVTAIVSGRSSKARQLADFYGIGDVYDYADFDAMAASGKVNAVYVATPNSSHCEYAVRAAKHGLHALVEKPLATSIADAESMISAAQAAGVYLMTAYRLHNDPATLRVAEMIASGIIGDVRHFTSSFAFQSAPDNHRLKASHWGGPLQDVGVYCLNAARHIFRDSPMSVSATPSSGHLDPRFKEVEEGIVVTLEFSKGRMAQFYAGFGTDTLDQFQIAGTKGSITLNNAYRFGVARKLTLQHGDQLQTTDFPETDNFSGMISYFADCIQKGTAPLADGAEGLADLAAMIAIEAAAKSQQPQAVLKFPPFRTYDASMIRSFPPVREKLLV
ncbi:MAG: Gfo/Idh/MocA family oxidoreductase [Hyphomicrobiales bacterium]|nr:Gfo/Idh/MocA family oxidoreductase [Hyphomicrobiales bacterium]